MKFNSLYPNAKYLDQFEFEGSFVVKDNIVHTCWHCQSPTVWYDGCFQAHLCSEECNRAKWKEYFNALDKEGLRDH